MIEEIPYRKITNDEFEHGIYRSYPAPPLEEQRRYLTRICEQMGACDPVALAESTLELAEWNGRTLITEGVSVQRYLLRLAYEHPELFRVDGAARLQDILERAEIECNATLLCTPKLKQKFIKKYGQEKYESLARLQPR